MTESRDERTVVIVADESATRGMLCGWLAQGGFRTLAFASAAEAIDRLSIEASNVAAAVVRMNDGLGDDVVTRLREVDPAIGAVVIRREQPGAWPAWTGPSSEPVVLQEPHDMATLHRAVSRESRGRLERLADGRWRGVIEAMVERQAESMERKLEQFAVASLEVLVTSLEARDPFMAGHSVRVAQLSASVAHTLGHGDDDVEAVRLAGRLHDIGMLVINDRVVNRDGPLDRDEFEQVRHHPMVGHQLLQPYPHLCDVARFVRGHHERWDGAGYPDGLAGHHIPWGARVLAAVEMYDALVTPRAYRARTLTPTEASHAIQRESGKALDPQVCQALVQLLGGRRTLDFVLDREYADRQFAGDPLLARIAAAV